MHDLYITFSKLNSILEAVKSYCLGTPSQHQRCNIAWICLSYRKSICLDFHLKKKQYILFINYKIMGNDKKRKIYIENSEKNMLMKRLKNEKKIDYEKNI